MSSSVFPLLRLPNELLMYIADFLGPPDFPSCNPGWLVLPAVCTRLRAVFRSSLDPSAGELSGHTYAAEEEECNVYWSCSPPVYSGGNVAFAHWSLHLKAEEDAGSYGWEAIDRHLGFPLLLHGPHCLNTTWITTLILECEAWEVGGAWDYCTFQYAPCFVAPALRWLDLRNYVVDWRCRGLEFLSVRMDSENYMYYRYPVAHLFERLVESRQTLQRVDLAHCLQTRYKADGAEGVIPDALTFPNLNKFELKTATNEAVYFAQRISFPSHCLPTFNVHGSAIGFLHCFSRDSNPHGGKTQMNALTIREAARTSGYGCTVTGSRISGMDELALHTYASERVPRLDRYGYGQEIGRLDGKTPGFEPVFIANLDWSVAAWSDPQSLGMSSTSVGPGDMQGVRYIFVNGKKGRLFKRGTASADVWTTLLRHLPNVRALYVNAPSYDALSPLLSIPKPDEPVLLPELRLLWLGCAPGRPKEDVDAGWLLDILAVRAGRAPDLDVDCMPECIRLVGDVGDVQHFS
ncbi:unnamed protein product [Peniophora sp. CBMAI 1063]|nr:unnamed protein product [Peniophora sp. CBMAI 1063]